MTTMVTTMILCSHWRLPGKYGEIFSVECTGDIHSLVIA